MEHITTFTGENFAPLTPDINQIKIEDIAHALSLICRANGHLTHFYSVAQHSINCANEAKAREYSVRVQLASLLHDASEAYISDITRPVKKHLPEYIIIEETLQNMIYEKFLGSTLSDEECELVKRVDDDMLAWEFNKLMGKKVSNDLPELKGRTSFEFIDYMAVENMFVKLADNLLNSKKPITVLGIDGCRFGWCLIKLDSLGNSSVCLIKNIRELLNVKADIAIIDIPIGLTDSDEERIFDKTAREQLKNRHSSVFTVPCKSAIYVEDYDTENAYKRACAINFKNTGKKISRQSFALIPKIREVDEFLYENPHFKGFLFEHHPELCFKELAGAPCKNNKREHQGEKERIGVLRKHMDILNLLHDHDFSINEVKRDDIIDAAILALSGLKRLLNIAG